MQAGFLISEKMKRPDSHVTEKKVGSFYQIGELNVDNNWFKNLL